jgi:hypothetical protein
MEPLFYMPSQDNTVFILCMVAVTILLGGAGLTLAFSLWRDHSVH